eukprot:TRINITY_DN81131_c0_g1_i1.p1 TRINITY_DN81131_c0_g1~~TRINITY_DN81131_c0_g1_i1.p1  ORF type:complete len:388 (+),score=68.74 TRINITY_DN81131_c0_g1_i1:120-1283(+)
MSANCVAPVEQEAALPQQGRRRVPVACEVVNGSAPIVVGQMQPQVVMVNGNGYAMHQASLQELQQHAPEGENGHLLVEVDAQQRHQQPLQMRITPSLQPPHSMMYVQQHPLHAGVSYSSSMPAAHHQAVWNGYAMAVPQLIQGYTVQQPQQPMYMPQYQVSQQQGDQVHLRGDQSPVAQLQQQPVQQAQPQFQVQMQPQRLRYVPPALPNTVPTDAGIEHLEPEHVYELLRHRQCLLVDVRGEDRAAGLIDGAVWERAIDKIPFIVKVPDLVQRWSQERLVVFTCQYSAHRAPQCANWYRAKADPRQRVAILSGGFRGWEARGLPVASAASSTGASQAADDFAMEHGLRFVRQYCHAAPNRVASQPATPNGYMTVAPSPYVVAAQPI